MKTSSALLNVATFVIDQEDQNGHRAPQHRGRGRRGGGGVSWKTNTEGGVFEKGGEQSLLDEEAEILFPPVRCC